MGHTVIQNLTLLLNGVSDDDHIGHVTHGGLCATPRASH